MIIKNNEIVKHAECTGRSLLSGESAGKLRVFATTVIRGSENTELTGFLFEIDWKTNRIRKLNLSLDFPAENFAHHYENYCKEEIFHLNSVYPHNHSLYVLSSRMNAFIRVKPDIKVVIKDNDLRAPHNGIIPVDNQVIINDTRNQCLRIYSLETGERQLSVFTPVFGAPQKSVQFASYGWQRGLFPIDHSIYLVGTSPAAIFEVDLKKALIGQVYQIDTDVKHCIHGLTAVKEL